MFRRDKRGALELSIGTVVIIVIGMTMLILGLVLVRTIFTGSVYNVEQLNQKVEGEINELFADEAKSYVHLPNHKAEVKKGKDFGVAFAIRNEETSTIDASNFHYDVIVADLSGCRGLTKEKAEGWIKSRKSGDMTISPGDSKINLVRFLIPEDAPLCIVPFDIVVTKDGIPYTTDFFDIVIG